ncbi:MAG: carbohydrate-binding family 9-like protein [Pyrinomonadaceae bacterium]|nr:carbohydrate-binding family 9-like protein [Pyrinomonadaceae bacterium]
MNASKVATIKYTESEPGLDASAWESAEVLYVDTHWSGESAEPARRFEARMVWSDNGLFVRFDCEQAEPLVVSAEPFLDSKTIGLWDRDVCEIFIAPDKNEPRRYFEFEVAPTGEWLDVAIDMTSGERVPVWNYRSGMQAAAHIEDGRFQMAIRIPWGAFGKKPEPGDVWLGNIFRCVGQGETRSYLAWNPTMTEKPNFHVPEAFGEFHFIR